MDKKWKVIALWVLPITIVILITWQILGSSTNTQVSQTNTSNPSRNAPVAKISYGRFLDYVKAGRVTSVDIYEGVEMQSSNQLIPKLITEFNV